MKKTLFLVPVLIALLFPSLSHAEAAFPDGCTATTKYSATTGQPCQKPACSPGDLFNFNTGQKCEGDASTLPEGCTTTAGFSPLTGKKCDGSVVSPSIIQNIVPQQEAISAPSVVPMLSQLHGNLKTVTFQTYPYTIYKIQYPSTEHPYSLSNHTDNLMLKIQVGGGRNRDEVVYITTPDGIIHQGTPSGNGIEFGKFAFITPFYPTEPGTYNVRFQVPAQSIDDTVQVVVKE